jgi:hypothetical protein
MNPRWWFLAVALAGPSCVLAWTAGQPPSGAFNPVLALAVWLLGGALLLAAAWFCRDAIRPERGPDPRAFQWPLMAAGVTPFLAMLAFLGVAPVPGVSTYNVGHAVWLSMAAGQLALFTLAIARPGWLVRAGPFSLVPVAGVGAMGVLVSPSLPTFFDAGGATLLYDAVLGTLAAWSVLCALPLLVAWMAREQVSAGLFAAALLLAGYSYTGFLLQRTPVESPTAWFGRMAMLAAAFLFAFGTVSGPMPVPRIAAEAEGSAASGAQAPKP